MGPLVLNRLLRIPVERQTDPVVSRQAQQSRQNVVVSIGGNQDIRVEPLQQMTNADHQLTPMTASKAVATLVDLHQQVTGTASIRRRRNRATRILKVPIQPKGHDPKWRQLVIRVPRGVERFDALYGPIHFVDRAVGERKELTLQNVSLRKRNIGVVVGEVREGSAGLVKEAWKASRDRNSHFQHFNWPIQEQIDTLRHPHFYWRAFSRERCA